ncbi:hypothetical protein C8R43DRAFT_954444 [Mycena crocata]|nr:hypothetical protein C8R43DRAFT_954444 [Mycena crocata]
MGYQFNIVLAQDIKEAVDAVPTASGCGLYRLSTDQSNELPADSTPHRMPESSSIQSSGAMLLTRASKLRMFTEPMNSPESEGQEACNIACSLCGSLSSRLPVRRKSFLPFRKPYRYTGFSPLKNPPEFHPLRSSFGPGDLGRDDEGQDSQMPSGISLRAGSPWPHCGFLVREVAPEHIRHHCETVGCDVGQRDEVRPRTGCRARLVSDAFLAHAGTSAARSTRINAGVINERGRMEGARSERAAQTQL